MNKVKVGLAIALVGILLYVGGLIYYTIVVEIENNPDITEIGGPPVITDLRLMVLVVTSIIIICFIGCKDTPLKEKEKDET